LKEIENTSDPESSFYQEKGRRHKSHMILKWAMLIATSIVPSFEPNYGIHVCLLPIGKYLPIVLLDLYFAGSATTYTTLAWIILYLLKHPQVQTKLQKELNEVTGGSRCPCLADRPRYMNFENI
jgi:hypothetical protein